MDTFILERDYTIVANKVIWKVDLMDMSGSTDSGIHFRIPDRIFVMALGTPKYVL